MTIIPIIYEDFSTPIIGFLILFVALVLVIVLPLVIIRWVFRINEQIELLSQIKEELRKLRLKKYPDKNPDDVNFL